ncbi:MAG: hypothetical protein Kow0088_06040 [Anaerolineales bacterium]
MKSKLQSFFDLFSPPQKIPPGIYSYQSPPDTPNPQKIHLRVESNASSIMMINASLVLHLNPIATEFAYAYLHQLDEAQIIQTITSKYRVDKETVRKDYRSFLEKINAVTTVQDLDPIEFFGLDRTVQKDWTNLSAPFRLDCALTYRLPHDEATVYAPTERVKEELSTQDWKKIIDKAWQAGVPHIIFTGGEPTLRTDLLELILHTENNGQVCGLITDGQVFHNDETLNDFLNAGLDHLMLLLDSRNQQSWKVIEKITPLDLFTAVHITINDENYHHLQEILSRLTDIGINALSLSAISEKHLEFLSEASEFATYLGLKLVWDLPVPYSKFNPVSIELVSEEQAESAGKAWLYIEPDGDVLLGQGLPTVMGNLLSQEWSEIWQLCRQHVKQQLPL